MGKILIFSLIIGSCLISCDKNRVFDNYKSLPGHWNRDSIAVFKVNEIDSVQPYNLFINLRNTNDYPYSNIILITSMNFPNGKVIKDTLEYKMAYPNGEWMGVGIGDSKASKLWYKKGVRFVEKGSYTFKIRQAMRKKGEKEGIQNLEGITEVGFRIEKPKQTNFKERE